MPSFKDLLDLLFNAWRWIRGRRNPVYLQAVRILQALMAHGVKPTQINMRLPGSLQMAALNWSSAEHLKDVLTQQHIDWFSEYLSFDPRWVEGEAESAHQHIFSYKAPQNLHEWLVQNRPSDQGLGFKLYLITADSSAMSINSTGPFAVILEALGSEDEPQISRYYHLTEAAVFGHRPCIHHLMEILAIAHYHRVIMQRAILPITKLILLSNHKGFIPTYLSVCRRHPLAADHEFWEHFSGNTPWLKELRLETQSALLNSGLADLVNVVEQHRERYARR